jgi:ORF6N domain-containing protein
MTKPIIAVGQVAQSIRFLRGQKVLLDFDLAALYGVATKVLNQAVKRNATRFPDDFMLRLTDAESERLLFQTGISKRADRHQTDRSRSQIVTLKRGENIKYRPYAFTEQGVAMLSSVLKSERAVKVNIAIMRAFVKLGKTLETNRELAREFSALEKPVGKHDDEISAIIDAIRQLMAPPEKPRREIGFQVRERAPRYGTQKTRGRNHLHD